MVWINDSEFTHASVCIANRDEHGYINNLIRILDYRRDINGNESYTWVHRDDGYAKRTNPEDPKTLYRKETLNALHESGEDFLFVKWKPNTDNPERPLLRDPYTRPYDYVPHFYEVLNSPANSIYELRKQLEVGWRYSGTPTQKVLVIYTGSTDNFSAVLLDRDDLDHSCNRIRLKASAPLGAQWFTLRARDIEYLPNSDRSHPSERTIYANPSLPQPRGKILIQSLPRYATQYMRWYASHVRLAESEDNRDLIVASLKDAFHSPEHLDEFGIKLSPADVQQLRKTIMRFINDDDQMRPLVHETLIKNPAFKQICVDVCRQEVLADASVARAIQQKQIESEFAAKQKDFDQYIQQKNNDIRRLEEQIRSRSESYERLTKLVQPLQAKVDDMHHQLDEAKNALDQLQKQKNKNLEEIEQQKTEALNRLDKDVALKLGLRAVVESVLSAQGTPPAAKAKDASMSPQIVQTNQTIQPIDYPSLPVTQRQFDFAHAVAINLQSYGVKPIKDHSHTPIALSKAYRRISSVAKMIAVDSMFAAPLANALSYAANGKPAKHISIPIDWHDTTALDRVLADEDSDILVLDGPIDTINENLLFALSRLESNTTILLPVGAYGNLRLIAWEVWNHVFYLPTEQYIKLPAASHQMLRSGEKYKPLAPPDEQTIFDTLTRLRAKAADNMALASLVLPATVAAQFDTPEERDSWIAAHLALQTYAALGTATAKATVNDNTAAKNLLARIERGRHAQ